MLARLFHRFHSKKSEKKDKKESIEQESNNTDQSPQARLYAQKEEEESVSYYQHDFTDNENSADDKLASPTSSKSSSGNHTHSLSMFSSLRSSSGSFDEDVDLSNLSQSDSSDGWLYKPDEKEDEPAEAKGVKNWFGTKKKKMREEDRQALIVHFTTLLFEYAVSLNTWKIGRLWRQNDVALEITCKKISIVMQALGSIKNERQTCTLERLAAILLSMPQEYQRYRASKGYAFQKGYEPEEHGMKEILQDVYDKLRPYISKDIRFKQLKC